jgi:hypothetical protein
MDHLRRFAVAFVAFAVSGNFAAAAAGQNLQVLVGSAAPDDEGIAAIPIVLVSGGAVVGGLQNDILFDNTIVSLAAVSSCQLNPAISFLAEGCDTPETTSLPCKNMIPRLRQCGADPQPAGCPPGSGPNLSVFRALIVPTAVLTMNPIPDGTLYTCRFDVLDAERLPAALDNRDVLVSDPLGERLTPVIAGSGAVLPAPEPTFTATETSTPASSPTAPDTPTASNTPTPTSTATLTPTSTATSTPTSSHTPTPTSSHTPTPSPSPTTTVTAGACVGDCDGSGAVTVDEITRLVSIALGTQGVAVCPSGDRDGDEMITVDEIQTAVNLGLNGCPQFPL